MSNSNLANYKKIAVMGGTFDPIHHGHLVAAQAVKDGFDVEMVLFIPTGRPPHKYDRQVSVNEHRYLMTVLATSSNPDFWVSRMELDRLGETYTIDTIKQLKKECARDSEIYFITGADAVHEILTWKHAQELLTLCDFIAVTRPGHNTELLLSELNRINDNFKSKLHFLEVPALAISSTEIRSLVASGKKIKYLLPNEVETYIIKNGLYKSFDYFQEFSGIKKFLKKTLTQKRYEHTLNVAETAVKLAKIYNYNIKKAYLAGLLHDCAKNLPDKKRIALCEKYKVKLDNLMIKQPELIHPFLGAAIAEHEFKINDKEILKAIKYHTTAHKKMSLLEKIVFLADTIEPNRSHYEGLTEIRRLTYLDIDKALVLALESKLDFCNKGSRSIHPLSIEALDYFRSISSEDK